MSGGIAIAVEALVLPLMGPETTMILDITITGAFGGVLDYTGSAEQLSFRASRVKIK